jgi:hypothetical protein
MVQNCVNHFTIKIYFLKQMVYDLKTGLFFEWFRYLNVQFSDVDYKLKLDRLLLTIIYSECPITDI